MPPIRYNPAPYQKESIPSGIPTAMGPPDIQILFDPTGNGSDSSGTPMSTVNFARIGEVVQGEISKRMDWIVKQFMDDLIHAYEAAITDLPRAEGEHLRQIIADAIYDSNVRRTGGRWPTGIEANILNVSAAEERTGVPYGFKKSSLFAMLEGTAGGSGDGHSTKYGFLSLEYAKQLAEQAANFAGLPPDERAAFLSRIATDFRGRHGGVAQDDEAGIMVKVQGPATVPNELAPAGISNLGDVLFNEVPQFGYAGQYVRPHPGYAILGIIKRFSVKGPPSLSKLADENGDWLGPALAPAFVEAANKIKNGMI